MEDKNNAPQINLGDEQKFMLRYDIQRSMCDLHNRCAIANDVYLKFCDKCTIEGGERKYCNECSNIKSLLDDSYALYCSYESMFDVKEFEKEYELELTLTKISDRTCVSEIFSEFDIVISHKDFIGYDRVLLKISFKPPVTTIRSDSLVGVFTKLLSSFNNMINFENRINDNKHNERLAIMKSEIEKHINHLKQSSISLIPTHKFNNQTNSYESTVLDFWLYDNNTLAEKIEGNNKEKNKMSDKNAI